MLGLQGLGQTLAALTAAGCCCAGGEPREPKPYQPRTEAEAGLFAEAKRDVLPDDIRENLKAHAAETLLWAGILRAVEIEGTTVRLRIEHHYWDWLEDHGDPFPAGIAALSPRGEGTYECLLELLSAEDAAAYRARTPPTGRMVITYGVPIELTGKGVVRLRCRRMASFQEGRFSTELLDYGRDGPSPEPAP